MLESKGIINIRLLANLLLHQPNSGEDDHIDHGAGGFLLSHTAVRVTWLQKKSHPTHLHHNMVTETFPEHIVLELHCHYLVLVLEGGVVLTNIDGQVI